MTKLNEGVLTIAGRPAARAEVKACATFAGEIAGTNPPVAPGRFARFGAGLAIALEAGPSAFVATEMLGQAHREGRTFEADIRIAGQGAFTGVWVVNAIEHVHGEPSDMVAEIAPAPGAIALFTPAAPAAAAPVAAAVAAPVAPPPVAETASTDAAAEAAAEE